MPAQSPVSECRMTMTV